MVEVEVGGCMKCVVVEVKKPHPAFSDAQKKTGLSHFSKGPFILFCHKKHEGHGYPQRIFMSSHFLNVCYGMDFLYILNFPFPQKFLLDDFI